MHVRKRKVGSERTEKAEIYGIILLLTRCLPASACCVIAKEEEDGKKSIPICDSWSPLFTHI
jgi:hypothetical protein